MPRLKANLICSCGKPAVARGLCRGCYDKSRLIPRIAISKEVESRVESLAKSKGWGIGQTVNFLLAFGLKWMDKKEQIEKEWGT